MRVEGYPLDDARDWRDEAACVEADPETFFPIGNTSRKATQQTQEAKAICRRCQVSEACLMWALESGQEFGIWGGLTEDERSALKRRSRRRA